jgi:hypothetical protein
MLKQCMSQDCPTHAYSSLPRQPGDRRRTGRAPQEMARANGTVRPSDMPMTMSRTVSHDVKWRSTWRVTGLASRGAAMTRIRRRKMQRSRRITGTCVPLSRSAPDVREVATAASVTADSASCGASRVGHGLPLVTHRLLPADSSTRTREISRLSGRKPQISSWLHVGGAAHSLPPAWCGSTKCSEHQCPLLGARWSSSFNRRVTTAWKCIRSFCVTTDLR